MGITCLKNLDIMLFTWSLMADIYVPSKCNTKRNSQKVMLKTIFYSLFWPIMILQRGGGVRKDGIFGHDPPDIFTGQLHPFLLFCKKPQKQTLSFYQICHFVEWWIGECLSNVLINRGSIQDPLIFIKFWSHGTYYFFTLKV